MLKKLSALVLCAVLLAALISATYRSGSVSRQLDYTDVSEFVIGTFEEKDGERWHFDGSSAVTVGEGNDARYGYYHFLEDTKGDAVIILGFNGETEVYTFDLMTEMGSFCLIGSAGDLSFTPLHIE